MTCSQVPSEDRGPSRDTFALCPGSRVGAAPLPRRLLEPPKVRSSPFCFQRGHGGQGGQATPISPASGRGMAAGRSPLVGHASPIEVCQFLEAAAPLVQVVVVLVLIGSRGVEGAEGAPLGAPALVVEDQ